MNRRVQIIGGGLAGLTLGIGLRQRDVPVTLHEAGHYPRHRVCGEFISGEGLLTLARLGLRQKIEQAGARLSRTAAFFVQRSGTRPLDLPQPALCLSRYTLDHLLASEFRRLGGDLLERTRSEISARTEGTVRATGRRAQPGKDGFHWFALKAHARNVTLIADLEMHASRRGYVGLCRIDGDAINVCGLFRGVRRNEPAQSSPREWLHGEPGSALHQRLAEAVFDEASLCAVAGLSLGPRRAREHGECCVGDAITLIPPITGNGMSMAFESAELAIEPLAAWWRGETSWNAASQKIAAECDAVFGSRLWWADWLQRCVFTPAMQRPLLWLTGHSDWCWRWGFARTR